MAAGFELARKSGPVSENVYTRRAQTAATVRIKFHKLRVEVDIRARTDKLQVHYKKGYYAPKN